MTGKQPLLGDGGGGARRDKAGPQLKYGGGVTFFKTRFFDLPQIFTWSMDTQDQADLKFAEQIFSLDSIKIGIFGILGPKYFFFLSTPLQAP